MGKERKRIRGYITIIICFVVILLGIDTILYFSFQTESECGQYQRYARQTLIIGNRGECIDYIKQTKECLNYEGELCIEWIEKYQLVKKEPS